MARPKETVSRQTDYIALEKSVAPIWDGYYHAWGMAFHNGRPPYTYIDAERFSTPYAAEQYLKQKVAEQRAENF